MGFQGSCLGTIQLVEVEVGDGSESGCASTVPAAKTVREDEGAVKLGTFNLSVLNLRSEVGVGYTPS